MNFWNFLKNKILFLFMWYILSVQEIRSDYSGMGPNTGLQALLSNRCRNVADNGLRDRTPTLLNPPSTPPLPPPPPPVDKNPSLTLPEILSSNEGGDETNKSLNFWLTTNSFPFSGEFSSLVLRSGEPTSLRGGNLRPVLLFPRLSSIRSVFLRRRCITGLVVGLLVGLPATAHWVAKSLNFCSVAMTNRTLPAQNLEQKKNPKKVRNEIQNWFRKRDLVTIIEEEKGGMAMENWKRSCLVFKLGFWRKSKGKNTDGLGRRTDFGVLSGRCFIYGLF